MKILSLFTLLTLLLIGCSSPAPQEPLIERNEEVRKYFDVLEELVDEYCTMVENITDSAMAIEDKEEAGEETTIMDGLSILTDMATSGMKIAELAEEIEGMEDQQKEFEENLSAADFKEFMSLYGTIIQRFYDVAKKLEAHESK